jgi:hypothetical protein
MDMRKAAAKSEGETGEVGSKLGGSVWSHKTKAGSGGQKGEWGGEAKSISKGESWAIDSWETEL